MKDKRYQVFVDPRADQKLAAHVEFLARAALRLYDQYEEAVLLLETGRKSVLFISRKSRSTQSCTPISSEGVIVLYLKSSVLLFSFMTFRIADRIWSRICYKKRDGCPMRQPSLSLSKKAISDQAGMGFKAQKGEKRA